MAKNGYEALEKLNQHSFDLVITDLEMPHLSGYELIEQVREDTRWNNLPIVVLTGRASKHIRQLTMNLGADEFIIKPFKENELFDKIRQFIQF
jgi:chemosensory pili system protein ChpA (sensor histidine kinase/response regulator)